MISASIKMKYS